MTIPLTVESQKNKDAASFFRPVIGVQKSSGHLAGTA